MVKHDAGNSMNRYHMGVINMSRGGGVIKPGNQAFYCNSIELLRRVCRVETLADGERLDPEHANEGLKRR